MNISINSLNQGINAKAHRKEDKFYKSLSIVSFNPNEVSNFNKGFSEPLDVRFYATASTTFCCIWGNVNGEHFNGSGKASGYGYDRSSAAFEQALKSAGFNCSGLSATGQNEEAINKIAREIMNLEYYTITRAHG